MPRWLALVNSWKQPQMRQCPPQSSQATGFTRLNRKTKSSAKTTALQLAIFVANHTHKQHHAVATPLVGKIIGVAEPRRLRTARTCVLMNRLLLRPTAIKLASRAKRKVTAASAQFAIEFSAILRQAIVPKLHHRRRAPTSWRLPATTSYAASTQKAAVVLATACSERNNLGW